MRLELDGGWGMEKKLAVWCCSKWKSAPAEPGSLCFMFRKREGQVGAPPTHDRSSCRPCTSCPSRRQPLWDFLNNKYVNHRQSALPNPTRQFREQSTPKTPCRPLISSKKANARVSNSAQQIRRQAVDGDGGIARPWPEGPGPPEATTATATITMSSCGSAAKHGSVFKSSTPDLRCDADQELQSPQRRTPPVLGAADPHHGLDSENLSSLVDLSRVCEGDARQTKQGTTDRDN